MNLKTIDTFIKNGSFGYARYHVVGGVIKMTAHNLTLSKLLGEEVVSNLQEEGHDIQSSLISVIRQWLYMVQQVAEDGKIRIFTTLLSNPNQHYRFLVFSMESNHITTLILELPTSRNDLWIEETIHQKTVTNLIDAVCVVDTDFNCIMIACSDKIYGYQLHEITPSMLKERILLKSPDIQMHVASLLQGETEFYKLEAIEERKDGTLESLRYFFTLLTEIDQTPLGALILSKNITDRLVNQKQLQSPQMMLDAILASTAEGIYGVDRYGECTFCNEACCHLLGYKSVDELLGHNMHALIHHHNEQGDLWPYKDSQIHQVLTTGKPTHRIETTIWRKDQTSFIGECYGYPQLDHGIVVGAIMTFYDVTKLKTTTRDLIESERSKSLFLSNIPGMAYRCRVDREWTMLFVSEGVKDLFGYQSEELLYNRDLSFNDLIEPAYHDFLWNRWNQVISNHEKFREEYQVRTKDGKVKWVLELGQGVYEEPNEVVALEGIIIDITEQKVRQQEAEYLNMYDQLTGLYNRIYFEKLIERYDQPRYFPLTYMIGDINGLKLVNDGYGHEFGDYHIKKVVEIIRKNIRSQDIVARIGGDEFAILFPNTTKEDTYSIFKKIIEDTHIYNKQKESYVPELSISMGFDTKNNTYTLFQEITKNAENFMNRRKLLERSSSHSDILRSIQTTMFERSQETEEHAERLAQLTHRLGGLFYLSQLEQDLLNLFSSLHDIGKVGINDQILKKPGALTEEEWIEMKKHPEIGYRICLSSPELASIADFILAHHERWDGTGYPLGLKGEQIPILSRILSIVDAYDSMTNDRVYRKALTKESALKEISDKAGTQFDPTIAKAFIEMMEK